MAGRTVTPWSAETKNEELLEDCAGPSRLRSLVTQCLDHIALLLRFLSFLIFFLFYFIF
jgi:hypothetical protein